MDWRSEAHGTYQEEPPANTLVAAHKTRLTDPNKWIYLHRLGYRSCGTNQSICQSRQNSELFLRLPIYAHGNRALATIVDGRGKIFTNNCNLFCVELDRGDHQAALSEAHRARSAAPKFESCLLQLHQSFKRFGHWTEAVLEFVAKRADVRELPRAGDPAVQFDLRLLVHDVLARARMRRP